MSVTTIHLLRHGEVDNPDAVLYGRMPGFSLTPLGKEMANTVADYLTHQGRDITHVFASPLLRAQQTAAPSAAAFGLTTQADPRLVEAESSFEGVPVNKNRWALAHPRNWRHYTHPHRPSWGEPYNQILNRVSASISSALDVARGHEALLVSHQLPIVTVQRFVAGLPLSHIPTRRRCSLASLTSLTFQGRSLVAVSYCEPAAELLGRSRDMSPGVSSAGVAKGE